jgi:hypothetical protein
MVLLLIINTVSFFIPYAYAVAISDPIG